MRKTHLPVRYVLAVGVSLLALAALATAQAAINWSSIDGGGGISGSTDLQLIGVIGQSDTIRMTGGDLSLSAGYLPLPVASELMFADSFE